MATKRFDLVQGRESDGKTFWNKIGSVWVTDDGKGWASFDSLPTAGINKKTGEIETRCQLFSGDRDKKQNRPPARTGGGGYADADYGKAPADDDIPF